MTPVEILALLQQLGPSLVQAVGAIVKALGAKDELAARRAFEAALRLQFVARQETKK